MIQLRQEEVAFYHELGRALTAWADVEYELCVVALNCFDGGKPISKLGPVTDFKAAFFSIENFRSKLQFSNVLVSRHLQGSVLLTEWAGLLRRLEGGTGAGLRNRLAHGVVTTWPVQFFERTGYKIPNGRLIGLGPREIDPPMNELPRNFSFLPGTLFVRDFALARIGFVSLAASLEDFRHRIDAPKGTPSKSPVPVERPPLTPQLIRQLREALALPPSPSKKKS